MEKTIATIAIMLVGIMLLVVLGFFAFAFGGADLFRSKKHDKEEN